MKVAANANSPERDDKKKLSNKLTGFDSSVLKKYLEQRSMKSHA